MANTYLTKTNSEGGSETKGTFSAWIKISELGDDNVIFHELESSGNYFSIKLKSGDFLVEAQNNASAFINIRTDRVLRDISGWFHVVVAIDSTQSTAADRVKIYINGVQETSFSASTYPPVNQNCKINQNNEVQTIGGAGATEYFSGLMSHINWVDGTAYAASSFGSTDSTTGEWKINTSPSVTYGTNGFLILKNGNSVTDQSGSSNDFSYSGGTLTNTEDCPDNVFATMNRLSPTTVALASMANGNLYNGDQSPNKWQAIPGTLAAGSGKIYWEVKIENVWGNTSQNSQRHGIGNIAAAVDNNTSDAYDIQWTSAAYGIGWCNSSGVRNSGSVTGTGNYSTFVATNILMFAMDLDNLKLYLGKNGVWEYSGDPTSGASGTGAYTIPAAGMWAPYSETRYGSDTISWNIGNGSFRTVAVSSAGTNASANGIFEYDVPTGYTALSTKGLNL